MIGNFEIQRPDLNLQSCVVNLSLFTQATDLLLCRPDFQFNSLADFANKTVWERSIALQYVFHIKNIIDVIDQSEDIILTESRQNFRYQSRHGKYRFAFILNIDVEYYAKLVKYAGQNLKCYLADLNNNLIGVRVGNAIKPFDLDNISIRKIPFATSQPSLTQIIIDLYDTSQIQNAYVIKPDFEPFNLRALYYNIQQSDDFIRDNCGEGYIGSTVTYTILGGSYISYVSQADADQQALEDITMNGQNYANTNGTCNLIITYWNTQQSDDFTRNNCGEGYIGSIVTYTIPANTYSSIVSQADANQQALDDIATNGQNYANANGTCNLITYYNTQQSQDFVRNNCGTDYIGSIVTYTIPANTYSSIVSQADANQQALDDIATNGQNYANANGTCLTRYLFNITSGEDTAPVFEGSLFGGGIYVINGTIEWSLQYGRTYNINLLTGESLDTVFDLNILKTRDLIVGKTYRVYMSFYHASLSGLSASYFMQAIGSPTQILASGAIQQDFVFNGEATLKLFVRYTAISNNVTATFNFQNIYFKQLD